MLAVIMRAQNIGPLDYPFIAAMQSAGMIADEIVIASAPGDVAHLEGLAEWLNLSATVKIIEVEGGYDSDWQVRFWYAAIANTEADWYFLLDGDECLPDEMDGAVETILASGLDFGNFPVKHFFGTPHFETHAPRFYTHHTRLGKAGNFIMSNERVYRKNAPICDMIGLTERGTHLIHVAGMEFVCQVQTPIHHYGWCRSDKAFERHRELGLIAYGASQRDPQEVLKAPLNSQFDMAAEREHLTRFNGAHPNWMMSWFQDHAEDALH